MLYWLLVPLRGDFFFFNVFRYITVRTALAGITALVLSFILGPRLIRLLQKRQIGQEIRPEGPQSHYAKKGTPSMGGLLIIICTLVPTLVWGNLANIYVWVAVLSMLLFGLGELAKVLVVFLVLFSQRHIIRGLVSGAIK